MGGRWLTAAFRLACPSSRAGGHEGLDLRIEGLVGDVSVMLAELGGRQTGHLAGLDPEAGGFEAGKDGAA